MSIALGPIGRNGEASGSVSTGGSVAAMYSYSKTRGLFGGLSIEGSMIVDRQDANSQAYRSDVTAKQILTGSIDRPEWASTLISTLERCTGSGNRQWVQNDIAQPGYAFSGVGNPGSEVSPSPKGKANKKKSSFPPAHWGAVDEDNFPNDYQNRAGPTTSSRGGDHLNGFDTHFDSDFAFEEESHQHPKVQATRGLDDDFSNDPAPPYDTPSDPSFGSSNPPRSAGLTSPFSSSSKSHKKSFSYTSSNPFYATQEVDDIDAMSRSTSSTGPRIQPKPELAKPLSPSEGVARAIALFDFKAVEPGDLSFSKGDVITITQKSQSTDDWWTGKVNGAQGIFPANHVEVV